MTAMIHGLLDSAARIAEAVEQGRGDEMIDNVAWRCAEAMVIALEAGAVMPKPQAQRLRDSLERAAREDRA